MTKKQRELPPGFVSASQAREILGTDMLHKYVKRGLIAGYGPEISRHKYYKREEVLALKASIDAFWEPARLDPASFQQAIPEDMDAIIEMDLKSFGLPFNGETYKRWQRNVPEAFQVLKTPEGRIVGYLCLLPIKREVLREFIAGKRDMDSIAGEDIERFEPGHPLHLYMIAIAVDPRYTGEVKRGYGSRLLKGIFTEFMEWGRRGVEIETVSARSFKFDGIKLMLDLGIPYVRAATPEMLLFSLRIEESEYPLFKAYRELLAQHPPEVL